MSIAIFAFITTFLLIGTALVLLFYRGNLMRRLGTVIDSNASDADVLKRSTIERAGSSIKAAIEPFEKVLPRSPQEVSVVQRRLIRAGFREAAHLKLFYGVKVVTPLCLCVIAGVSGAAKFGSFFIYPVALGLGYLVPDFWLGRVIAKRYEKIRAGLPDFLDLIVICIEAGLSLDQALARSAEELRSPQPEISDEMGLVILEMRAGRPRLDAWRNLAERADIDIVRLLVSAIIQADQFGSSVAKTLRVHSETLRVQRKQKVEEVAAKLPVKLVFPLAIFIFPSLFVVALGPAILRMIEGFQKYLH